MMTNKTKICAYGTLVGGYRDPYKKGITWLIEDDTGHVFKCRTPIETPLFIGKRYELFGYFVKTYETIDCWITVLSEVMAIKEIIGPVLPTDVIYSN